MHSCFNHNFCTFASSSRSPNSAAIDCPCWPPAAAAAAAVGSVLPASAAPCGCPGSARSSASRSRLRAVMRRSAISRSRSFSLSQFAMRLRLPSCPTTMGPTWSICTLSPNPSCIPLPPPPAASHGAGSASTWDDPATSAQSAGAGSRGWNVSVSTVV